MLVSLEYLQKTLNKEEFHKLQKSTIDVEYGWEEFPFVELSDVIQLLGRDIAPPDKRPVFEIMHGMNEYPKALCDAATMFIRNKNLLLTAEKRGPFVYVEPSELMFYTQKYIEPRETDGRPSENFLTIPELVKKHSIGPVRVGEKGKVMIADQKAPGVAWLYQVSRRWKSTHKAPNGRIYIDKDEAAQKIKKWKERRRAKGL